MLVYFFGGGWTLGTIDTSDGVCRALTNAAGCVTVVGGLPAGTRTPVPRGDRRLLTPAPRGSPSTRPIWVSTRAGWPSAGTARAATWPPGSRCWPATGVPALAHQLLVYPNTDYLSDTPSLRENTDPLLFNSTSVDWYWRPLPDSPGDGVHPLASPLRAADLSGLPPATVITAEYDPLRDQAEQYARAVARQWCAGRR